LVEKFRGEKREMFAVGIVVVIWSIWKTMNSEKKWPDELIFKIFYYINSWSCLQVKEDVKDRMVFCANLLVKVAKDVFGARGCWTSWIPRLAM
jgi:hypothetical protein